MSTVVEPSNNEAIDAQAEKLYSDYVFEHRMDQITRADFVQGIENLFKRNFPQLEWLVQYTSTGNSFGINIGLLTIRYTDQDKFSWVVINAAVLLVDGCVSCSYIKNTIPVETVIRDITDTWIIKSCDTPMSFTQLADNITTECQKQLEQPYSVDIKFLTSQIQSRKGDILDRIVVTIVIIVDRYTTYCVDKVMYRRPGEHTYYLTQTLDA